MYLSILAQEAPGVTKSMADPQLANRTLFATYFQVMVYALACYGLPAWCKGDRLKVTNGRELIFRPAFKKPRFLPVAVVAALEFVYRGGCGSSAVNALWLRMIYQGVTAKKIVYEGFEVVKRLATWV